MVAAPSISHAEVSQAEVDDILDRMIDLSRAGRALDLRLARLLAWLKRMDLSPIGYGSYTAFCRERVDWKSSWTHQLVRLAESDLEEVKTAVCLGMIRMTDAVRAPGNVEREGQAAWVEAAMQGVLERPRRKPRTPTVEITGADIRTVHDARWLARLCPGRAVSDPAADRYILDCHGRRPAEILAEARTPPPAPAPLPPWCTAPDPAAPLAGEWHDPVDLSDALALLDGVQRLRRERILALGRAFADVAARRLHIEMGYGTLSEFARQALHLDVRSLERYRQLGETVELVGQSLDLNRLEQVGRIATEQTQADWVAIARWHQRARERCLRLPKLSPSPAPRGQARRHA